jgi:hypothetical protein
VGTPLLAHPPVSLANIYASDRLVDVKFIMLTNQDDFTNCINLNAQQQIKSVGNISLQFTKTKKDDNTTMISKKINTLEMPESRARQMASQLPLEEQVSQIS